MAKFSRRAILLTGVAAGGGLALWYGARQLDDGVAAQKFAAAGTDGAPLNAFVKITPTGEVICAVHRAEMGQGVTTSLPMLLAEELDADWQQVRFEFAPVDRDYFNFGIMLRGQPLGDPRERWLAGPGNAMIRRMFHAMGMAMTISSASAIDAWDSLRPAGATARAMLIDAAAKRWGLPADSLATEPGQVVDPTTDRRLDYGALAADAARLRPPSRPTLKSAQQFRLIGTSPARLDVPKKVTGHTGYGIDVTLPDMLIGAIALGPVAGGAIADVIPAAADNVHSVVRVGANAVAVLADDTWTALSAARKLALNDATSGSKANSTNLFNGYAASLDTPRTVFVEPEPDAARETPAQTVAAEYRVPFLAHACLEPMNCTALVDAGRVTLWAPTQALSIAADVAARVAGVDKSAVSVHRTFMGGGFGRRAEMDFVEYAVAAAMAVPGRPVKIVYSREQDMRHDMYRPAALAQIEASLDADGMLAAFDYRLATQSVTASYYERTPTPRGGDAESDGSVATGARDLIYAVPQLSVSYTSQAPGVPVGYWRSTGCSYNGFIVESFIDELAAAASIDPLEFRLRHLGERPKHRAVLEAVARLADWDLPTTPNRGRGIALIDNSDSLCAQVVDIYVSPNWELTVERVCCVFDPRFVIHPDSVRAQLESSIVDGLSAALFGEITLTDGAVDQSNFDDYRFLRLGETPEITIELLPQGGRPGGVGEPAVPTTAPALVNAIYSATGRRIRELPISRQLTPESGAIINPS